MLFEADTALCPRPDMPVETFVGFAYVGAPWNAYPDSNFPWWCRNLGHCVGNNGLSLWRREVLQNVTAREPREYEHSVARYLHQDRGSATKRPPATQRSMLMSNASVFYQHDHSDVWLSQVLQSLESEGQLKMPAVPNDVVGSRFSVETLYNAKSPWVPVGVHKPHRYLTAAQLAALYERCPPARAVLNYSAFDSAALLSAADRAGKR